MKNRNTPIKIYFTEDHANMIKKHSEATSRSMSEIVDEIVGMFFSGKLNGGSSKDIEIQLRKISDMLNNIQQTCNSSYRSSDYTAHLITQGFSKNVRNAHGDLVIKPSVDAEQLARKKALKDYSALRNGTLEKESYLKGVLEEVEDEEEPEQIIPVETNPEDDADLNNY